MNLEVPAKQQKKDVSSFFDYADDVSEIIAPNGDVSMELVEYSKLKRLGPTADPLEFWKVSLLVLRIRLDLIV